MESLKTSIARQYRAKYPNSPTLTLARLLYRENISLYKDVEQARSCLRVIEGKAGDKNRQRYKDKSLYKEEERSRNPYKLPDSEEQEFKPYKISKKCQRILLLSDIHIPYHSIDAITLALDYGKQKKVDTIILNGDTIDFYMLSRFEKDPRKRSFASELEATRQFLTTLRKNFPDAHIFYKCGNHDIRLERYLMVKAPELLGVPEFQLPKLLHFDDLDIKWIDDKVIMKLNALNIIHGHEFATSFFSPVNVARGLFLRGNAVAIQGHNHQTSENTVTTLNGEMITTWSTGCLCELHPTYMPFNKWNHGFAYIEVEGKGFEVFNKRIKNGKVF